MKHALRDFPPEVFGLPRCVFALLGADLSLRGDPPMFMRFGSGRRILRRAFGSFSTGRRMFGSTRGSVLIAPGHLSPGKRSLLIPPFRVREASGGFRWRFGRLHPASGVFGGKGPGSDLL